MRSKESCFTSDSVEPKVLAPGMYAIDVKPIPHPLKNNRSAHLNYISHLKESVQKVREDCRGYIKSKRSTECQAGSIARSNPTTQKNTIEICLRRMCPLTKLSVKCRTGHPLVSGLRLFKTYDGESFKAHEFCGKVHRDSQILEMITS
ncbi:hypothetical protein Tco_1501747 [Tanacetum coccineum]